MYYATVQIKVMCSTLQKTYFYGDYLMKNIGKITFFSLLLFGIIQMHLFSEEKKQLVLTEDLSVSYALENNVSIKRSEINLKQTKREYSHSWNNILPSISLSANGGEKASFEEGKSDLLSLNAGASANLNLDFGLASKIKKLKTSYEAGLTNYEDTVRETETAVRKAFYNLLFLKEKVSSAKTTMESYQRQYEQTQAKYKRGLASELDLLTSQVNLETSKPDVDTAEMNYRNSLVEFLITIGLEPEPNCEILLEGSLSEANNVKKINAEIVKNAEEKSSEVKELENSLKIAEYERSQTFGSTIFPSLTASASVYPESISYDKSTSVKTSDSNWSFSLGLNIPVDSWIPGSASKDTISKLDDKINDYKLQIEEKKKSVKTSAIEKLKTIEVSQQTLKTRELNLELAQKSFNMTEEAYNRGTKDLLTLQNALDTLKNAELQLKSEQYTLISNVLDLENMLSLPSKSLFEEKSF